MPSAFEMTPLKHRLPPTVFLNMKLTLPRLGLTLALLLGFTAAPARATSVIAPDFDSLVTQADYVVRAKVKAVTSEWRENPDRPGERYIASRIELEVTEVITGTPPTPLVIQQVGGTVGEERMEILGAPKFAVGEESILFVRGNGRVITPFVGLMHGHYPITRDPSSGEEQVRRSNGKALYHEVEVALPLAATSGIALSNPKAKPISPATFATRIRQAAEALNASNREKLN